MKFNRMKGKELASLIFLWVVLIIAMIGLIAGCATRQPQTQIYYEGDKALVITFDKDTSWVVYPIDSVRWIRK